MIHINVVQTFIFIIYHAIYEFILFIKLLDKKSPHISNVALAAVIATN